jgi:hypothetical protein
MENFAPVVPAGGIALMVLSAYRFVFLLLRQPHPIYSRQFLALCLQKLRLFFEQEFRLTLVLGLCLGSHFALNLFFQPLSLPWHFPVLTGILITLLGKLFTRTIRFLLNKQAFQQSVVGEWLFLLIQGQGMATALQVVGQLAGLTGLLCLFPFTREVELLFLVNGFALGGAGMALIWQLADLPQAFPIEKVFLSSYRLDLLQVLVLSGVFTGMSLSGQLLFLLFPVLLSLFTVCCSLLIKALSQYHRAFEFDEFITGLLVVFFSLSFIELLLPACWVLDGVEYERRGLWMTIGLAVGVSWLCSKTGTLYQLVQAWLQASQPRWKWISLILTGLLQGSSSLLLFFWLALGGYIGFVLGDLYGLLLGCIVIFSQLNTRMAAENL